MTRPTAAPFDGGISSLSKLASFLRQAEDVIGQINLHPSLHGVIAQLVKSSRIPEGEIADVVQALDDNSSNDGTPNLCSRLGPKTYVLIFAILRVSEPCWPQLRGLCLLMEALDETDIQVRNTQTSLSTLDNAPLISRKARIGADILRLALRHFCNNDVDHGLRQWMGLLTLELLRDCRENVNLLAAEAEERRHVLGSTVIEEQNELLRYIAGSVVKNLVSQGASASLFWSADNERATYGTFFECEAQSSQWLEKFENHLDEIDSQTSVHEHKVALFSHMLQLGRRSAAMDSSSILVTLNGFLSIAIPEWVNKLGRIEAAQYIDVPLENIAEVDIREPPVEAPRVSADSQGRSFVDIHLVGKDGCTFYMNAKAQKQLFIGLAFDSATTAKYLKRLISTQKSYILSRQTNDQSPINVSQEDLRRVSWSHGAGGTRQTILGAAPVSPAVKLRRVLKGSDHPSILDPNRDGPDQVIPANERAMPDTTQIAEEQRLVATAARVSNLLSLGLPWDSMHRHSEGPVPAPKPSPAGTRQHAIRVSYAGSPVDPSYADVDGAPQPRSNFAQPRGQKIGRVSTGLIADSQSSQHTGDVLDQSYTNTAPWRNGASTIDHAEELVEVVRDSYETNEAIQESGEQSTSQESSGPGTPGQLHEALRQGADNSTIAPSAQSSNDIEALPACANASAIARKPLAVKINQRLLGRRGEHLSPAKAGCEESPVTKPQEAFKPGRRNTKYPGETQSPLKIRNTYKSRNTKEATEVAGKDSSVAPGGEANVFDIPSSPTRTTREPSKSKLTRIAASDAKPLIKKQATEVRGHTKQPTAGSAGRGNAARDVYINSVQGDKDPEYDNNKRENANENEKKKKTKSSKKKSDTTGHFGNSTVGKKSKASKVAASSVTKQLPVRSAENIVTKAPGKKRKSTPAGLIHPERRRAAAINANQKIQGLSTKVENKRQEHNEPLRSPRSEEAALHDDQAGEFKQDDQVVNDMRGVASAASKGASSDAKKSIGLDQDLADPAVGKGYVNELELQPQRIPEVLQAIFVDHHEALNGEESVAGAPMETDDVEESREVKPTAEGVRADPVYPLHETETTSIPAVGIISLQKPVDLVNAGAGLGSTEGKISRHVRVATISDPSSDVGSPALQIATNTMPIVSKSSKLSPEMKVSKPASKVEVEEPTVCGQSHAVETPGIAGKDKNSVDHSVVRRRVVTLNEATACQSILDTGTKSIPERLRNNSALKKSDPDADQMLSTVSAARPDDTPQIIQISSGEEYSSESESLSSPKDILRTVPPASYLNKKRKSEDTIEDSVKRVRLSTPGAAQKEEVAEETYAIAMDDYIQRKSVIIGFDTTGPRNQGVSSGKQPRTFTIPHHQQGEISRNTPSFSVKRKHPDDQESTKESSDPKRVMKTPAEKRRRTVNVVPPTRSECTRSYAQTSNPHLASQSHQTNSQGSRVLDNGSPMASIDQVRWTKGVDMDHLLRRLSESESSLFKAESFDMEEDDEVHNTKLWEPELPLPIRPPGFPQPASVHALKRYERRSSSNTKALPSSPTAPSRMLEDMTAHQIASDGRFVNVYTATVVKTTEPQDPFMDNAHSLPNPFLRMLRASALEDDGKQGQVNSMKHLAKQVDVDTSAPLFDPDRTLVEAETRHHGRLPSSSHGEPSSSPTSVGKRHSLTSESDQDKKREELAQEWMEALRPHQRGALASLHEMSNRLIKQLISKESAIDDAVKEYDVGGHKLLDALKNAHSESQQDHRAFLAKTKQSLTASYGDIKRKIEHRVKEVKRGRVTNMEKKWKQEQQQNQEYINVVILALGE